MMTQGPMIRPVHFEIPAADPEALADFYRQVFSWRIEKLPGWDYWVCKTGDGPGIDGAITRKASPPTGPVNYANVADIDMHLKQVQQGGGKVLVPRTPVPGMGWYALAQDPEGNPLGFWHPDPTAG